MLNILRNIAFIDYVLTNPWMLLLLAFQIWMLVDAVRRKEWMWAFFIFIGFFLSAFLYYFAVYRGSPSSTRGFELPGAHDRKRIKELEAKIHHLDKAHHRSQLGDVYFQGGKLAKAEACYRAALEREPEDIDTRAHLGQCLLRQKRIPEAKPLLEGVVQQEPDHDYGHSMMALAETLGALGETDRALALWQYVTEHHAYPRGRVQLAELYITRKEIEPARAILKDVLADEPHAPAFQRRRDRVWTRKARSLLRKIGG